MSVTVPTGVCVLLVPSPHSTLRSRATLLSCYSCLPGLPSPGLFNFFFKLSFIGVQLFYNVVLLSAVQQSESVIHINLSSPF